jgi:predicted nucleic acid-binding protein
MAIVIDASIVAVWVFPDEESSLAREAAEIVRGRYGLVPSLFWFEVRNLLLVGERRGRIPAEHTTAFLSKLDELPLEMDRGCASQRLLDLARGNGLTAYDAAYLELAERRAVPLATLDRRLATAAVAAGVAVLG